MMPRPIEIDGWTLVKRNGIVHVSATLTGNCVRLYECEERETRGWAGSLELPADVLCEIADIYRTSDRVSDARQRELEY